MFYEDIPSCSMRRKRVIQTKRGEESEIADWWQKESESEKKVGREETKVGSHRGRWEKLPRPHLLSPMDIFKVKDYGSKENEDKGGTKR